jgi:hypothetical protein
MSEARSEAEIRKWQRRSFMLTLLGSVGAALLFFYSFVLGAWLGPGPLHPIEIAVGTTFSLLLGSFMSRPILKRRIEMKARWVTELKLGKKRCRVAFFEDHAQVGREILVLARVQSTKLNGGTLTVSYDRFGDPEPLTFVLSGPEPSIERAQKYFERAA